MAGAIKVNEAQVSTATVQVKTLSVGGRQMTLAVFRQLLCSPVLAADTAELLGTPWGTVNYFWGDCREGDHLHVVWQQGDELRRSCVVPSRERACTPGGRWPTETERTRQQVLAQRYRAVLVAWAAAQAEAGRAFERKHKTIELVADGIKHELQRPEHEMRSITAEVFWRLEPSWEECEDGNPLSTRRETPEQRAQRQEAGRQHRLEGLREFVAKALADNGLPKALLSYSEPALARYASAVSAEFHESVAQTKALNAKWEAAYAALCALPQLFIAT